MPRGIITDANVVGSVTSNSSIVQAATNQSTDLQQNKSSAGTVLGGANANGQIWSGATTPINYQVGGTPTATSGTGSTATITLTSASNLAVGDLIRVTGFTPTGYNTTGYAIVTAVSNSAPFSVSYASTVTGAMTVAGQVQTIPQASFVARNAATVPLIVKGNAYNVNLSTWQNPAGQTIFALNPYGSIVSSASANSFTSDNGGNYILRTVGTADQRGNHYQVTSSASTILAGFNGQGQIFTGSTTPIQGSATIAINTQTPTGTTNITITTASAHGILVGQTVVIAGITPAGYNGTWTAQSGTTGSTLVVNIGSNPGAITVAGTVTRNSQLGVTAASASTVAAVIRAAASQTANLQEWQTSTPSTVASVSATGNISTSGGFTLSGANSPITLPSGGNGTSGQVLTSAGSGATPTWATPNGKYPDGWVFSNANSTAATTTTSQSIFQAGARSYALTAGKTYSFQLKLDLSIAFPAGSPFSVRLDPTFSQTPQAINYHSTYFGTGSSTPYAAKITTTGVQVVTPTFSAAAGGYIIVDGFFRANATTGGTFEAKFQLSTISPGGSATMLTGSWIKIIDLGVSTAPGIISGTWT